MSRTDTEVTFTDNPSSQTDLLTENYVLVCTNMGHFLNISAIIMTDEYLASKPAPLTKSNIGGAKLLPDEGLKHIYI